MELIIHSTFPDVLETDWNNLLAESVSHVPFLRYDYLKTWWQTKGGGEWANPQLLFITAHRDDRLIAGAPLFMDLNNQGQPTVNLIGSVEISDYLDLVVRPKDLDEFIHALLQFLDGSEIPHWGSIDFYNILETSPTLPALLNESVKLGWKYKQETLQHCPYIPLPGDWETYLSGIDKKQRHEIRRKMRRIEESGLEVKWYFIENRGELDHAIESFLGMMEQAEDKAAFLTAPMREHMDNIIRCAFDAQCLKLAFLEINGEIAATKLCFDYLNRLWGYNSGFNRRFLEYSPGWVLTAYLIRWANEQKRSEFDFMRGNEEYKYRFGGVDRFILRGTISR